MKMLSSFTEYFIGCSYPLYKKSFAEKVKRHEISCYKRNDSHNSIDNHLTVPLFWGWKSVGRHTAIIADLLLDLFLSNTIITISSSFWCTIIVRLSLSLLLPFSTRSEKYRLSWYLSPYKICIFYSSAFPTIYNPLFRTSLWMAMLTFTSVPGFSMPTLGLIWNLLVVDTLNCIAEELPWILEERCLCFWCSGKREGADLACIERQGTHWG